jgi:predicted P-loop ATPase
MLGAVSRVFQPGLKFDYMLCLAGGQGAGKSTFFRFLALKDEWFTDDLKRIDKEDVYLQMQGHWIIEMSEMLATANAKSIEEIKSFISRLKETYRTPYDKFPKDRQRQCVFGGTTNTLSFLPLDRTGNRRFLPVPLHREKAEIHLLADEPASRAYIEQLWAEVMEIYRSGNFSLDLSPEMEAEAERLRREFMPEDPKAGMIQAFLDSYTGKHVCTQLLYKDALKNEFQKPKDWELKEIGDIMNNSIVGWEKCSNQRYPEFGSQRSWRRIQKKEPVVEQLEITEDFPVIEDTDLPADWE